MLSNFDKLLNQSQVKLVDGVTLKRKSKLTSDKEESHKVACDKTSLHLLPQVQARLKNMIETHVLEFDLLSVLNEGKFSFFA